MSFISEYWQYLTVAGAAVLLSLGLFLITRKREEEKISLNGEQNHFPIESLPFKVEHSLTNSQIKKARDDLRVLDLEKEILSYAVRYLYEAESEGKINKNERDRLVNGYRERMEKINNIISESESIVFLDELETTQEDLLTLFSERFSELNQKIDDLRSRLEIKQLKEKTALEEESVPPSDQLPLTEQRREEKPKLIPQKTEAEERIDKIRSEIEEVLERLEQIEIEE